MDEGLSGYVVGPSAILPRGYLWLAPVWYAIAATTLALVSWPPLWFRISADIGLAASTVTFMYALGSVRVRAFSVDQTGVRLGLSPNSRRRSNYRRIARGLTWHQIDRVRLISRPNGVLLEFLLDPRAGSEPGATTKPTPASPIAQLRELAPLLIWPVRYARRPTGLTTVVDGPPRFQVPLQDYTVDDLRHVLRALAPSRVTVAVFGPDW